MFSFRRMVIIAQGVYYCATGLWPLISMDTFEAVTGEKTDDWLVYMVGALAAVIGATLLVAARKKSLSVEAIALALLSAIAFAAIDTVFALNGTISRIYLADAVAQAIIFFAIIGGGRRRQAA